MHAAGDSNARPFNSRKFLQGCFDSSRVSDRHECFANPTASGYEAKELRIRQLLAAAGSSGESHREAVSIEARGPEVEADWNSLKSPETYVGQQRGENFASPGVRC